MDTDAVAIVGFITLFALMMLRVPVGMAMGLVGVTGFSYLVNWDAAFKIVGHTSMRTVTDYTFGVIPMFLLMGAFVTNSGMSRELFRAANGFLGHRRGGLGVATIATAFVSETLVGTLQAFADMAHLSDFFVAAVIVAVLGNATEHGSAVLLARRGRVKLATEIPLASSAQIAGLVIPLVALISWGFTPLALSFRPVELAAMAVAAALPALVLRTGRTSRLGGAILLAAYSALAVAFYLSGDP